MPPASAAAMSDLQAIFMAAQNAAQDKAQKTAAAAASQAAEKAAIEALTQALQALEAKRKTAHEAIDADFTIPQPS